MQNSHLMGNYGDRALTLVGGQGSRVWDDQGKEYLDAVTGLAVCGLGHSHPDVADAVAEQSKSLTHCSNLFNIPWQQELGDRLSRLSGLDKAFFCNSGTEANEAAIKLCRLYGHSKGIEIPEILVCEGAFHGRSLGALSATWGSKARNGFAPLLEGFTHIAYGDIQAVEASASENTVAVMLEPIQGEAGIVIPPAGYLKQLRDLCNRKGWLLVLDEIQTGNGRTGSYFACDHEGVKPDVLATAKGLGNGLPIGACLATEKVAALLVPGTHGSTFGGNPLVSRAACAVIDTIENQNLCERASQLGSWLLDAFKQELAEVDHVIDIRGAGLMLAIELEASCGELVAAAADAGLIINVTGGNRVRLLPALTMSDEEAQLLVDTLCPLIKNWQAS
ncbi:MAG: aspartate aminotransferase family protein [Porticoccaceae bacterium]|nr:aspartate aminotransferase family protein [Porticoccaceae bacterium]